VALDLSDPRLYDQAKPEDRLLFLQQQLRGIATSAMQARAAGDTADLANLLALFKQVAQRASELTAAVNQADQPSSFMLALSGLSDEILADGQAIGGAFLDTAKAAKGTIDATLGASTLLLRFLPWVLVAVVVVILIVLFRSRKFSIAGVGGASR
jgi:hypothetical protein